MKIEPNARKKKWCMDGQMKYWADYKDQPVDFVGP